jgi:hypothetical protein
MINARVSMSAVKLVSDFPVRGFPGPIDKSTYTVTFQTEALSSTEP